MDITKAEGILQVIGGYLQLLQSQDVLVNPYEDWSAAEIADGVCTVLDRLKTPYKTVDHGKSTAIIIQG